MCLDAYNIECYLHKQLIHTMNTFFIRPKYIFYDIVLLMILNKVVSDSYIELENSGIENMKTERRIRTCDYVTRSWAFFVEKNLKKIPKITKIV